MTPSGPRATLIVVAWALPLTFFHWDWGAGGTRALILLSWAVVLWLSVRLARPLSSAGAVTAVVSRFLPGLCACLLLAQLAVGVGSVVWTARHHDIRLDQGQNTYRAVRTLLRGRSPYGRGVVLDLVAYRARATLRRQAGFPPPAPPAVIDRYWRTLDEVDRDRLLPPLAAPSPEARREAALLGYKYGPADVLAALPVVMLFGQAGIPLLNVLCLLLLAPAVFFLLRAARISSLGCWLGLALVLADAHLAWSCLFLSATDIRVVVPLVLALRALIRRRAIAGGIWLGLAVAVKPVPAVLFVPLLLTTSWAGALACLAVVILLFTPFFVWDGAGALHNLVLWGLERTTDSTSWLHRAPPTAALAGKAALLAAGGLLIWRLICRSRPGSPEQFRNLAFLSGVAMLGSGMFHNDYLPWVTFLIAGALMASFFPLRGPISAAAATDTKTAPDARRDVGHPPGPDPPGSTARRRPP